MIRFMVYAVVVSSALSCSTAQDLKVKSPETYHEQIEQHRSEYKEDFIKDERSPLKKKDFEFMHFYEADKNYRCECDVTLTPDSKPFEMATYSGKTKPFKKYAVSNCSLNGKKVEVNIYSSLRVQAMPGYADYLFLPFKDHTNGEDTYGGGRYIDLLKGDIENGKVVLDFNKCYNPWCAYSDGYNCPIPPLENHFDLAIQAGEKMWTGKKKH